MGEVRTLLLLALGAVRVFAVTAPDSIAGKIYRDASSMSGLGSVLEERTLGFDVENRFTFLKFASGGSLIFAAPNSVILRDSPGDGSYVYRKSGAATATVELTFADNTKSSIDLTFDSPTTGTCTYGVGFTGGFAFFDQATARTAPAANVSLRGRVDSAHALIAGFVIPGPPDPNPNANHFAPKLGSQTREVLVRVVGPSLAPFGVTGAWANPDFQLFVGDQPAVLGEILYPDWSTILDFPNAINSEAAFRKIFGYVGAFPLISGSKDAAAVVRLNPGAYTIVCNPAAGDPGGEALIEVYFLP
jgi:hypothetical protein